MRLLVIQNDPFTPASLAGEVMQNGGASLDVLLPHDGDRLPLSSQSHDGAVILGGPQHSGDEEKYPVFRPMIELLRDFHQRRKPLLGICLGAQLLARTFGQRVRPHDTFEWGFSPLRMTEAGMNDPLLRGLHPQQRILQWHEDTFDWPENAVPLMEGEQCRNQAYRVGATTYAFQCHFEVSRETAEDWLARWGERTADHRYGAQRGPQELARVKKEVEEHLESANEFCRQISGRWLELVRQRRGELAA